MNVIYVVYVVVNVTFGVYVLSPYEYFVCQYLSYQQLPYL